MNRKRSSYNRAMFTPEEREILLKRFLGRAESDPRISGVAVTGSGATGSEDRWSDIDLAFGVRGAESVREVLSEWSDYLFSECGAVHHADITAGEWIYRVFLLRNTLQVDLAFVEEEHFRALTPGFRLVHGSAREPAHLAPANSETLIGMAWLYALHARSAIARGLPWQAEHMVSGLRDQVLALSCLRFGLPTAHGKGIDRLPQEVLVPLEACLFRNLELPELYRAFSASIDCLLLESRAANEDLAAKLGPVLRVLKLRPDST